MGPPAHRNRGFAPPPTPNTHLQVASEARGVSGTALPHSAVWLVLGKWAESKVSCDVCQSTRKLTTLPNSEDEVTEAISRDLLKQSHLPPEVSLVLTTSLPGGEVPLCLKLQRFPSHSEGNSIFLPYLWMCVCACAHYSQLKRKSRSMPAHSRHSINICRIDESFE